MKKILLLLVGILFIVSTSACSSDDPVQDSGNEDNVTEDSGKGYFSGKKVLVAYFSWGGTSHR